MKIEWVEEKIINEIKEVESVAELTKYTSHSAYAGKQRALQQEWIFIQRVVPNSNMLFKN